ncbi:MAG TPA: hypothetical protein VHC49_16030 [Mycobacteriales bacterium]|nr:hypothetical protein [Mycobacteriales bacterium]
MDDAVTAYEAMRVAEAAVKQIWKRRLGKLLFPYWCALENETAYVFGYTTADWSGRGARWDYPGVFVPVINKPDGTLQLEPSGPEFFQRHPELTEIPRHKLAPPLAWDTGVAEGLGLAGRPVTPYEGLLIARCVVERSWRKRKQGNLVMPTDYAREFDEFYAFSYDGDKPRPGIFGVKMLPLVRKCDGAVHEFMDPLPVEFRFPGQGRDIPRDQLLAP